MQVLFHVERPTGIPGRHLNQIPNEPNGQGDDRYGTSRGEYRTLQCQTCHARNVIDAQTLSELHNKLSKMDGLHRSGRRVNRSSKETPMLRRKPPIDDDDDLMTNRNRTEKKKKRRREVAIAVERSERAVKSN